MKKILSLIALLTFAMTGSAFGAALATGSVTASDGLSIYGGSSAAVAAGATKVLIGKTSKGVRAGARYITTGYALNTKHDSGTKAFGTAHDATAIYTTETGVGALTTAPTAADYSSFSTWTAM